MHDYSAGLLAYDHRFSNLPDSINIESVVFFESLPNTVAGQHRNQTDFPFKRIKYILLFAPNNLHIQFSTQIYQIF